MNTTTRLAASLALAATCLAASAQTAPMAPASQPTAVGVAPDTARAANDAAVKRSDVATVVRTGPTAADKARQMKADTESKMGADGTTVAARSTTDNANRAPRSDRN